MTFNELDMRFNPDCNLTSKIIDVEASYINATKIILSHGNKQEN